MSEIAHLAAQIFRRASGRSRLIVAIAGAPGSGKSTLAESLQAALVAGGQSAAVVAMDGFHFDDAVLIARGQRNRKGAPETFDVAGFRHLLTRLRAGEADVAAPVFDRTLEISRAGGAIVAGDTRIILVEGPKFVLERWEGGHRKVQLPDGITGWLVPLKGEGVADGVPFRAGDCVTLQGGAELEATMGSDLLFAYPGTHRI